MLALTVTAAVASAFSNGAYLVLHAADLIGIDKYDDAVRGTGPGTQQAHFGQFFNSDGDGCWPENNGRSYSCDLVSIGGVHFDTGDLGEVEPSIAIARLASGYLCAAAHDGVRCWEWSADVPPRPAKSPAGAKYVRLENAGRFVCGLTIGGRSVACWTVGTDQREYSEVVQTFDETQNPSSFLVRADPERFTVRQDGQSSWLKTYYLFFRESAAHRQDRLWRSSDGKLVSPSGEPTVCWPSPENRRPCEASAAPRYPSDDY